MFDNDIYDIVIVGAGPAGLWAAMELANHAKVLLIESVRRLHDTRNVSNGFMGGSAKSDVQLFVDPGFGGNIMDVDLVEYFITYLHSYSGHSLKFMNCNLPTRKLEHLLKHKVNVDCPTSILISADKFTNIETNIKKFLEKNVAFRPDCTFLNVSKNKKMFEVQTSAGTVMARKCILAMGRGGAYFLSNHNLLKNIVIADNTFDLGVRLEFPHAMIKDFVDKSPGFRLRWDDYRTTTFCVKGSVEMEDVFGIKTSNARSVHGKQTHSTSVGILKTFKADNALSTVTNLVQIANILGDGQLLRDSLNRVLENKWPVGPIAEFSTLIDGIAKFADIFPQIKQKCFVFSPEARINTFKFKLSKHMETDIKGLYIIGDMSGNTNSFVQAACSGLLAALHILGKK